MRSALICGLTSSSTSDWVFILGTVSGLSEAKELAQKLALRVERPLAHACPPLKRPNFVRCDLGLFGGTPHRAICRGCSNYTAASGEPIDSHPNGPKESRSGPLHRDATGMQHQKQRILLRSFLSPGDILMLTATVRDLHYSYPNQFETAVETSCPAIWENNPYVTAHATGDRPWAQSTCIIPWLIKAITVQYTSLRGLANI